MVLCRYRNWGVFGTGTWSSTVLPNANQQRKLKFAFLYETADLAGIPFRRLVWALRHERGEQFGREHYHYRLTSAGTGLVLDLAPAGPGRLLDQRTWDDGRNQHWLIEPTSDGHHRIVSQASQHVLAAAGGKLAETAWNNTPAQRWPFTATSGDHAHH